jgi:hypothetical protein
MSAQINNLGKSFFLLRRELPKPQAAQDLRSLHRLPRQSLPWQSVERMALALLWPRETILDEAGRKGQM